LASNSFFNKSHEEIEMIYKALKDPDNNKQFLDSLGLTDPDAIFQTHALRE